MLLSRLLIWVWLACMVVSACSSQASNAGGRGSAPARGPQERTSPDWFEVGAIPELHFTLDAEQAAKLQREPREYANASMREGTRAPLAVAIKLKGSSGSFRSFDDKPGLTIDCNRVDGSGEFHGLVKYHLNNAVQDRSYLREDLAYEISRRAGLPAPRVTHARVWLQGRDLGIYVLKESYDKRFLKRNFRGAIGNLYDGGVNGEVQDQLDRDVGQGVPDHQDLKALAASCALPAGAARVAALRACLDIEQFLTFMAVEVMIGHWDGYTLNPNNYRVYFPRKSQRAVFLLHGTDQVFQRPEAKVFGEVKGRVARCVLAEPEWRAAYAERVRALLPLLAPADALIAHLQQRASRLQAIVQASMGDEQVAQLLVEQEHLQRVLRERAAFLVTAAAEGWPQVLDVPAAGLALGALPWHVQCDNPGVRLDGVDGGPEDPLVITAFDCGECIASFRATLWLPPGRYQLRATMTMADVVASSDYNPGAGIRISRGHRDAVAQGTEQERQVAFAFAVADEPRDVVLVLELRASRGQVSFARQSLQLVPIP